MVVDGKKSTYGQLNSMDRLSDLPDSIIHHIISFLGTEEACRTTILSKRWAYIWSTGLILDFKPEFFIPKIDGECVDEYVGSSTGPYGDETVEKFMNFIESTMRRYSEKNLSIKKFNLEYPCTDQVMAGRIDRWVGIALQNQVEELSLRVTPKNPPLYALPAILFSAKSLISMTLSWVRLPYIQDIKLISLRSLDLTMGFVDEQMLQNIIVSSPLKILTINACSGVSNISVPCYSRLQSLYVAGTVPLDGTILVDTSSIKHFTYRGYCDHWKFILTPASRKNLRVLRILKAFIDDDIFSKLVSELSSIEEILLFDCPMDFSIRIASQTLKELGIHDCYDLCCVTMEAPQLDSFCYNGDSQLSSVTNSHNNYNAYFHLTVNNLDTRAFMSIQQLLSKSNCCKILSIIVSDEPVVPEIEFDEDKLSCFLLGPSSDAIDIPELKLSVLCHNHTPEVSTCRALIDGLLWCCRPDILSVTVTLPSDNSVIKSFLEILEKKVKYWKHPLKGMEIEGTNDCSSFLSSWDLEVRLKLFW